LYSNWLQPNSKLQPSRFEKFSWGEIPGLLLTGMWRGKERGEEGKGN